MSRILLVILGRTAFKKYRWKIKKFLGYCLRICPITSSEFGCFRNFVSENSGLTGLNLFRFDRLWRIMVATAFSVFWILICFSFQVHDPYDCNDDIIEFAVVQRLLYRKGIGRACAYCQATDVKLKTCERCYDAFYCNRFIFNLVLWELVFIYSFISMSFLKGLFILHICIIYCSLLHICIIYCSELFPCICKVLWQIKYLIRSYTYIIQNRIISFTLISFKAV